MNSSGRRQTRREMMERMARLAGGGLLSQGLVASSLGASVSQYDPKLSVQIYVWIQQFQAQKKTISQGDEEALTAIHRAGYRRVELTSDFFQPDVRAQTLALLRKYNLEPATTYASSTMHEAQAAEKSIAKILELAGVLKSAGGRWIVTNPSPKPRQARKSDEELDTQARYVNRLGDELHKQGIRLMIHHHTPELVDNAREWRHLLAHTDSRLVTYCVDVNWAVRGRQDAIEFLRAASDRLVSLHLRNEKQGVWMEDFGDGDTDYHKVAAYMKGINFNGYLVVELAYEKNTKITRSLEEDLRLSRLYTEKTFGLRSS